jgi:hypothetical protein
LEDDGNQAFNLPLALALSLALSGCASAQYVPTVPMQARSGDVQIALDRLALGRRHVLVYRTQSTADHAVRQGWLTVPTRDPCTGGTEATALVVDGADGAGAALTPGVHQLRVSFPPFPDDMGLDLVVDLGMQDGSCVRAPAISQSIPLQAPGRFVLVGSLGVDGSADLGGLSGVVAGKLGGGGWIGDFLLTAEAGLGATTCSASLCGKDDDGRLRSGLAFPVELDVRYAVATGVWLDSISVGFLGARYSFVPGRLPAPGGDRRLWVHGFHAVLSWGFGLMRNGEGPFRRVERTPLLEALVPVGILFDPAAPTNTVAFSAGLGMRMLLPP